MRHWLWLLAFAAATARADILVRDDAGTTVRLAQPARRIVSLAPHVTETLFAAGAGERLIGAVDYSDYPEAARKLPRIGSHAQLDLEAIVALKPDLAVGWATGNGPVQVAKLRALGVPVYLAEPARIDDIATNLERFGELAGTQGTARSAAVNFRERLEDLRGRHGARPKVRTFYEVWNQPLTTIGGTQIISDLIRLCGGENVFGGLKALAPRVSVEAVLAADPEAIVASGMDSARPEWLDDWRRWGSMTAVKRGNLFFVPPDIVQRPTPRLADGADRLCAHLETARRRRP